MDSADELHCWFHSPAGLAPSPSHLPPPQLFASYARVIKKCPNSPLLPLVLQGGAQHAHQVNLELVTARHDALLSEVDRPKKRARVEDGNVAADEAKPAIQALEPAWKLVELAADEAELRSFRSGLDFLETQRAIKRLGHLDRDAQRENHLTRIQKQNHLTRSGLGGGDIIRMLVWCSH